MTRLDHLNMTVEDLKESTEWYQGVFGFDRVEHGLYGGRPWAILRSGGSMLCLYERPGRKHLESDDASQRKIHQVAHFGLAVESRSAWEESVRKYKLKVEYGGAVRYPNSWSWYITDPSGYEIEVVIWDGNEATF